MQAKRAGRRAILLGSILLAGGEALAAERVHVLYPAGACKDGRLQIEVFQRGSDGKPGVWKPHLEHPVVAPDTCQLEDKGILLNEIRVRCVDTKGAVYSDWIVGVDLTPSGLRCPAP